MSRIPLIVILGPTSVGKTKVSIELAKRIHGEIISADSRQIYREMNIGTDKPTKEERQEIVHHLIDIVDPDELFNLSHYVELAWETLAQVHLKNKIPVLVGSAGLYIRALCEGYVLPAVPPDEALRAYLLERIRLEGGKVLYDELAELDPEGVRHLDPGNTRRLIRFYEILKKTGIPPSEIWKQRDSRAAGLDVVKFGLIRSREKLYERIEQRVQEQENQGLLREVENLLKKYPRHLKAFQTHSYQEVFPYLEGTCSWEESKKLIIRHTFQYARRQWIWFKKEKGVHWEQAEPFGQWGNLASKLEKIWVAYHVKSSP